MDGRIRGKGVGWASGGGVYSAQRTMVTFWKRIYWRFGGREIGEIVYYLVVIGEEIAPDWGIVNTYT